MDQATYPLFLDSHVCRFRGGLFGLCSWLGLGIFYLLLFSMRGLLITCDRIRRADGHDYGPDSEVRDGQAHQEHIRNLKQECS